MEDFAEKEAFGIALAMCPDDAFKAACAVFGDDTGSALRASQKWLKDPIVTASKLRYIESHGNKPVLPTKEEFAVEILQFARQKNEDGTRFIYDGRERLQAYELAAKLMDYMPKAGAINLTQNNDNRTQNVMYVPQPSSNDDWETRLEQQQKELTSVAAN